MSNSVPSTSLLLNPADLDRFVKGVADTVTRRKPVDNPDVDGGGGTQGPDTTPVVPITDAPTGGSSGGIVTPTPKADNKAIVAGLVGVAAVVAVTIMLIMVVKRAAK